MVTVNGIDPLAMNDNPLNAGGGGGGGDGNKHRRLESASESTF